MAFLVYACRYDDSASLKDGEWVNVVAKVSVEFRAEYGQEGPVLTAVSVEKTQAPKNPVISFN